MLCCLCEKVCNNEYNLRTHKENENSRKDNNVTVEEKFVENLVNNNLKMKEDFRNLQDNFERLSDIYQKERNKSSENKGEIEIELQKTREEYRKIKTENEALKVKNDTLFKLGNIATEQNQRLKQKTGEPEEEAIKIVEEEVAEVEKELYKIVEKILLRILKRISMED